MRRHRAPRVATTVAAVLTVLAAFGCRSQTVQPGPRNDAGMAPVLVIERFLQAANTNDVQTMGRLFGTTQGSLTKRDKREEVEQRMFAIASILRHDNYSIQPEQIVPGRIGQAVRYPVRMRIGQRTVVVPFTLVRTNADGWLVEQVDLEAALRNR